MDIDYLSKCLNGKFNSYVVKFLDSHDLIYLICCCKYFSFLQSLLIEISDVYTSTIIKNNWSQDKKKRSNHENQSGQNRSWYLLGIVWRPNGIFPGNICQPGL